MNQKGSATIFALVGTVIVVGLGFLLGQTVFRAGSGGYQVPTAGTADLTNVTGTLAVSSGGTGVTALTQGQILSSDGSVVLQNANFVLDSDTTRLGLGTTTPFRLLSL